MPKVKITEVDNTGAIQLDSVSNVVYIPGASEVDVEPWFCDSPRKLYSAATKYKEGDVESGTPNPDYKGYIKDGSYRLAYRLLQLGMQVLYEGVAVSSSESDTVVENTYTTSLITEDSETYFKVLGSDIVFSVNDNTVSYTYEGTAVEVNIDDGVATFASMPDIIKRATFDFINNKVNYVREVQESFDVDLSNIDWNRLSDLNKYNLRFLTTGAYAQPSKEMLECAYKRGDCTALIDHENFETYSVDDVRDSIETILNKTTEPVNSFCSAFSPWIRVRLTTDASVEDTLPGSAGYLLAYARSVQNNPNWYAAAGSYRGVISELVKPVYELSKAEAEKLQARGKFGEVSLDDPEDNVGFAINPICEIRPFGFIVYGNRTLVVNEGTTKATSFLNVRNLVSTLKKELYFASNKYTFEQNNEVLWINFKSQITPLLDRMQSGNGIEGYELIRERTDKKARLKARVVIIPIEAVEDFELEVSMEDSLEVIEG